MEVEAEMVSVIDFERVDGDSECKKDSTVSHVH